MKPKQSINWYKKDEKQYDVVGKFYTICTSKNRQCGLKMIDKCDLYVSTSFYTPVSFVTKWSEVKYGNGIGILLKPEYKDIKKELIEVDIMKYASRATNGVYHMGISMVKQILVDLKIID